MSTQSIAYIRVSTIEQSTARQEQGFKDRSIYIDKTFIEKASGADKERPVLAECMAYARTGDTLYIYSIDRLARNMTHLQSIVETLAQKGVIVHFVKESLIFSGDDNPISKLLFQIISSIAEYERTIIKERQREGIAVAKIKGTKSGKPIGRQPLDMSRRTEAIELSKAGKNISQISKIMNLSRPSISKLLS